MNTVIETGRILEISDQINGILSSQVVTNMARSIAKLHRLLDDYGAGWICYLVVTQSGNIAYKTKSKAELHSYTYSEYSGQERIIGLPTGVMPSSVADWIECNLPTFARLINGMYIQQSSISGDSLHLLTEDARKAMYELERAAQEDLGRGRIVSLEPHEWLDAVRGDILKLKDDELEDYINECINYGEPFEIPDDSGDRATVDFNKAMNWARKLRA